MKKIFSILILAISAAVMSCSSSMDERLQSAEMVAVSLDYTVGSNTTRSGDSPLYTRIYGMVVSKELIADRYVLTFTDKDTGESFSMSGEWKNPAQVYIKSGTYRVTGVSSAYGDGLGIQDRCSVKFDCEVTVDRNNTNLVLRATYDCFLLIFDRKAVSDAYITYVDNDASLVTKHFFELDGMYYGFASHLANPSYTGSQCLTVKYINNKTVEMKSSGLSVQNGMYYIFDATTAPSDMTSRQTTTFSIDKMSWGKL